MESRLKLNLLHKIFFCFKFRNDIDHTEYKEIIFSPLFKEIFSEIRKDLFSFNEKMESEMTKEMQFDSEDFERAKYIIRGAGIHSELSLELKKELIEYLVYPYIISEKIENELLKEFDSN
jgi:hypothetical protein